MSSGVFVACVVDGMTPEKCAELFALTSETVVARLHNARNLLVEPVETVRTVLPRRRFCPGCAIWSSTTKDSHVLTNRLSVLTLGHRYITIIQ
jgi:hypothetical protein